ncbi:type IVB secretion system protein IcmH/DotU [Colwellia psychrerythraea]|uniref:Type IV / VI secretion system protein, DotU family n=1 Tax=Colwellia psychrerythraea TaxID=28229 RepID=A0A099KX96_COLPS|nr:type IVB secretion system protein IcmH/DotU [Colwellia psychrerythraea]KGJ94810.1 type IV / VI secretion system protein, DotU family [Colwellia psychrerythraea]
MSVDNPDKTVFRQPINRGDGTVVRPMPGGRAPSNQASPPPSMQQPYQPQPAQPVSMPRANVVDNFSTTSGLNPLVNAAATLLAVFSKTRESLSHPNVGSLHQQLDREIKTFDMKARNGGIKEDTVMVSRYLLCTILDEAVLNTPWGAESAWNQRTLLGIFHKETAGGEKFFAILDRLRNTPAENIEVLELIYICLSLGYEGKYRVVARGRDQLEQLRDDLFFIIRSYRGEYERSLSPCWQGLANSRNTLLNYIPMWVVASVFVGIMALTYSGFRYWLDESSYSVSQQLSEIKSENNQTVKDLPSAN